MGGVALLLTDCGGCTYPLPRYGFWYFMAVIFHKVFAWIIGKVLILKGGHLRS